MSPVPRHGFELRAAGIGKRFGGRTVLHEFDLTVKEGEFVAITGPSGSGKSTVLNILGLISTPTCGQLQINQRDLVHASDSERSRYRGRFISFIYQAFHLAPTLTVAENVELGVVSQLDPGVEVAKRVSAAMEAVGISGLAGQLPAVLSGGEQQRVAIARALARQTPLLLADEPTGNLDPSNAHATLTLLQDQVSAGATLVLVTHDPDLAAQADRVIALDVSEPP